MSSEAEYWKGWLQKNHGFSPHSKRTLPGNVVQHNYRPTVEKHDSDLYMALRPHFNQQISEDGNTFYTHKNEQGLTIALTHKKSEFNTYYHGDAGPIASAHVIHNNSVYSSAQPLDDAEDLTTQADNMSKRLHEESVKAYHLNPTDENFVAHLHEAISLHPEWSKYLKLNKQATQARLLVKKKARGV